MIEDREALDRVEEIASVEGVDLVTVGIHDLAESMGIRQANDPALRKVATEVAQRITDLGKARMGFSFGHSVLTLSMPELMEMGVSYVNVLPPPEVRLRMMLSELVASLRKEAEL
jgi:2-keto-3-deoxy-L-rhamnonate aldolase RhmA